MTLPTHLIAGLVLGKLTGNYALSVTGALFLDVDHIFSYIKNGILLKPKKLWTVLLSKEDPYGDQRFIFHNVLVFILISFIVFLVNQKIGLVFSMAYLSHIILDALDNSDYFPFFPNKKMNIRGPIKYFSKGELIFFCLLIIIFYLV